jgi:hypothetical protein
VSIPVSADARGGADVSRGLQIPADGGITTWFNGDILTTKLTRQAPQVTTSQTRKIEVSEDTRHPSFRKSMKAFSSERRVVPA